MYVELPMYVADRATCCAAQMILQLSAALCPQPTGLVRLHINKTLSLSLSLSLPHIHTHTHIVFIQFRWSFRSQGCSKTFPHHSPSFAIHSSISLSIDRSSSIWGEKKPSFSFFTLKSIISGHLEETFWTKCVGGGLAGLDILCDGSNTHTTSNIKSLWINLWGVFFGGRHREGRGGKPWEVKNLVNWFFFLVAPNDLFFFSGEILQEGK